MSYVKKIQDMTESEQKAYMINSLAAIKDAINAQGGNVTDSTPYADYASKIAGTTVIEAKAITPSTEAQTITASGNVDGFSPITVSAVDSNIDPNILSNNIIQGVTILGVSGSAVELKGETVEVTPSTSAQTIEPTEGKNGITSISVAAVTAAIDANILAENIKSGVTILGVEGTYTGEQEQQEPQE